MKSKTSNLYIREVGELRCGIRTLAGHPERKIKYVWELVKHLKEDLETDFRKTKEKINGLVHPTAVLYSPENIIIETGAEIEALAVLDARSGPIYIGKGTIVRPQSYLRGPLSIGPECRIGGELTHSIFHGYSNKAHYGFLGHAYVGEWVNLGAGTTNSNLKNTYGTVKVAGIDTGEQFMGCLIGDFAKLGIGTLIPTGAVVGLGANYFSGGLMPKELGNFSWGLNEKYRLEDFLKAVEQMMRRRHCQLTKELEEKLRRIY